MVNTFELKIIQTISWIFEVVDSLNTAFHMIVWLHLLKSTLYYLNPNSDKLVWDTNINYCAVINLLSYSTSLHLTIYCIKMYFNWCRPLSHFGLMGVKSMFLLLLFEKINSINFSLWYRVYPNIYLLTISCILRFRC